MGKLISAIFIITCLSLGYVYQQVNLLECSYKMEDNRQRLCLLIDRNENLRYNIASLKSPVNIKQQIADKQIDLKPVQQWHNIRLARLPEQNQKQNNLSYDSSFKVASRLLLNIFTPKSEAIAQELNRTERSQKSEAIAQELDRTEHLR